MDDQAAALREIIEESRDSGKRAQRVITLVPVGINAHIDDFAANFALAVADEDKKTLVIDTRDDTARILKLLKIARADEMELLFSGEKRMEELARISFDKRLRYINARSAIFEMSRGSSQSWMKKAMDKFFACCEDYEAIVFISGGFETNDQKSMIYAGGDCVAVMCDDNSSIVECFKLCRAAGRAGDISVAINNAKDRAAAITTVQNFKVITRRQLGEAPELFGIVRVDDMSQKAFCAEETYYSAYPASDATKDMQSMVNIYLDQDRDQPELLRSYIRKAGRVFAPETDDGNSQEDYGKQ